MSRHHIILLYNRGLQFKLIINLQLKVKPMNRREIRMQSATSVALKMRSKHALS